VADFRAKRMQLAQILGCVCRKYARESTVEVSYRYNEQNRISSVNKPIVNVT